MVKAAKIEEIIEDVVVKKTRSWKLIIIIVLVVVIIAVLVSSIYFYTKYQSAIQSPSNITKDQVMQLVDKVSKLMELPKNETPTIATVSDKAKLIGQAFFVNAENGDKVLIYSSAKKAILYRPGINKIIEVAPINLGAEVNQPVASPSVKISQPISLLILNGTKKSGLASSAQKRIEGQITTINNISLGNSQKDYAKTVIINPSSNKQIEDQLVKLIGGEVVKALPEGENISKADITIILGEDYR